MAIPFSGLSSSSDFIVSSEHITPTIVKPIWLYVKNIIAGICFLLSSIFGLLLYFECEWWPMFILIACVGWILIFGTPIIIIEDNITRYSIFNKSSLKEQVSAYLNVTKYWRVIVTIQILFTLTLIVILLPELSVASLFVSILYFLLNILCLIQGYKSVPSMYDYLVKNQSFKQCITVSEMVTTPTIRKLYDSEIETEEIKLLDGCHLEVVRGENWKTSGFVLTNPIGLKKTFLMGNYLDVQKLQMHDRANILRSITRDINDELYIVESKRILS